MWLTRCFVFGAPENTKYQIPKTKYTSDTGHTRKKLLEQWVHQAAGHSESACVLARPIRRVESADSFLGAILGKYKYKYK